ncbi:hypothetical protein Hanom_Chr13g01217631 [Helianthus anomalus]
MRRGMHSQAGPSHRCTPFASFSSDPYDDSRHSLEPARRFVSLSTSPSYHHSFGPQQPEEPQNPHHSLHSHRSHYSSYHSSHHSHSQGHFDYINAPACHNLLGPEDHFPEDMDVDEDPDPAMPPSGTPTHPIDISSGSSFAGSPNRGPDEYFQAVTPPPAKEQPPPPPEPSRRRRNARMFVRGGPPTFAAPPPPMGFENPIPAYPDTTQYNPF